MGGINMIITTLITGVIIALLVSIVFDNWQFWLALAGAVATWYVISTKAVGSWLKRRDAKVTVEHTVRGYGGRFDNIDKDRAACRAEQDSRYRELKQGQLTTLVAIEKMGDDISNNVQAYVMRLDIKFEEERRSYKEDIKAVHKRIDQLYNKIT